MANKPYKYQENDGGLHALTTDGPAQPSEGPNMDQAAAFIANLYKGLKKQGLSHDEAKDIAAACMQAFVPKNTPPSQ